MARGTRTAPLCVVLEPIDQQSIALWKIYGERGVAIMNTVGNIRAVLERAGACEGIVSPVRYMRLGTPSRDEDVSTSAVSFSLV